MNAAAATVIFPMMEGAAKLVSLDISKRKVGAEMATIGALYARYAVLPAPGDYAPVE